MFPEEEGVEFSQANQGNQGEAGDGFWEGHGPGGCWSGIRKAAQQFLPAEIPSAGVWPEMRISHPRQQQSLSSPPKLQITLNPTPAGAEHLSCQAMRCSVNKLQLVQPHLCRCYLPQGADPS